MSKIEDQQKHCLAKAENLENSHRRQEAPEQIQKHLKDLAKLDSAMPYDPTKDLGEQLTDLVIPGTDSHTESVVNSEVYAVHCGDKTRIFGSNRNGHYVSYTEETSPDAEIPDASELGLRSLEKIMGGLEPVAAGEVISNGDLTAADGLGLELPPRMLAEYVSGLSHQDLSSNGSYDKKAKTLSIASLIPDGSAKMSTATSVLDSVLLDPPTREGVEVFTVAQIANKLSAEDRKLFVEDLNTEISANEGNPVKTKLLENIKARIKS